MGKKSQGKTRAQSMVEMALILPVLLLVLFGLIEFGRALFIYTVVSNAAREGARQGLVEPTNLDLIRQAAYSRAILIPTPTLGITITYDNGDINNPISADEIIEGRSRVVVRVGYRFRMITPIISSIFRPVRISFLSARTISPGARAHKPSQPLPTNPPVPTWTPGGPTIPPPATWTPSPVPPTMTEGPTPTPSPVPPTHTPTPTMTEGPTPTPSPVPPTNTPTPPLPTHTPTPIPPTPSPTPQTLTVVFRTNYPCKKNTGNNPVYVWAYVYDAGNNPVAGATVQVRIAGGAWTALTDQGNGYYGGAGTCWVSANYGGHVDVELDAQKSGYTGDTALENTANQPSCSSCP